jgi:SAM-dependent methyltransferase
MFELLKWGARRSDISDADLPSASALDAPTTTSKVFPAFLTLMSRVPAPVVLDLGPVTGGNVEFLGDRLGCKLFIDDISADVERHTRAGTLDELTASFATRFHYDEASVDGVLCWNCLDVMERTAARALAKQIVRLVRPGGAVMALFRTSATQPPHWTKYEILDERHLRARRLQGDTSRRQALANRDITRLFDGLVIAESVLLKSHTREILLRRA